MYIFPSFKLHSISCGALKNLSSSNPILLNNSISLFDSIFIPTVMSGQKRLSSILEGIQENRKTAASSGGPYLYDEALASDQQMVEELLETESFDELVCAMAGMKFKALSRKKADDVSETLKDQVKAQSREFRS